MTNRKNSRLVTMELDLEAYKVKNKCLSEHLTKVQHEKAQAYQELNNLRQQYWKLYRKYCSIKSIIRDNMKDNINLLTNHQEKLKKFFTEENGSSAESSMKSNESRNRTASLYDNRSQRSALNSNERSFDSVTEGISTRVVTTRKKYNSDKENSVRDTASINENISPAYSGVDSSPRMAEVQVNIRKRKEPTEDDGRRGGEGPDQDLWDVDVRLKGDDTNTNRSLDTSDDAEEDDEEKLDTIQEEDEEIGYWTESAKRLKLMVTERRLGPDAAVDEDSSMICQLDETVIGKITFL
ncbi:unnamed protein product [Callosobruchus maculatus]|uniref:Uncharacterized protein n=1 Tax=Callosobruchus maculatus TaxID=64391 RepID=A0A653BXI6_CALMS|nr:unnamed protein product [Callosobruchus maculatus]